MIGSERQSSQALHLLDPEMIGPRLPECDVRQNIFEMLVVTGAGREDHHAWPQHVYLFRERVIRLLDRGEPPVEVAPLDACCEIRP